MAASRWLMWTYCGLKVADTEVLPTVPFGKGSTLKSPTCQTVQPHHWQQGSAIFMECWNDTSGILCMV